MTDKNNSGDSDVLVIGDSCMDIFTYGLAERLCPDVPAPVFKPLRRVKGMGMAGNLFKNLESLGVKCDICTNPTKASKERFVDLETNHTFLRVDVGDDIPRVTRRWLEGYDLGQYKAIAIADYGKGFLENDDIQYLCENNGNVFLDTKKQLGDFCAKARCIKINLPEYVEIVEDLTLEDWKDKLIVTQGKRGATFYTGCEDNNGWEKFEAESVEVYDVTGAGDTFHAGLIMRYLASNDLRSSITYANACAAKVVQQRGVSVPESDETQEA